MAAGSGALDFLGIGAHRAGTTWLHALLESHPDIWLPPIKEVHHFDQLAQHSPLLAAERARHRRARLGAWAKEPWRRTSGGRRVSGFADIAALAAYDAGALLGRASHRRYLGLFSRARARGQTVGEITPAYALLAPEDIAQVRAKVGPAKILYVIREPMARMWSHLTKGGPRELGAPVSALEDEAQRRFLLRPHCLERTAYAATLGRWQEAFGPENVLLLFFDDIVTAPEAFASQLAAFLELTPGGWDFPGPLNSYQKPGDAPSEVLQATLAGIALREIAALRALGVASPHLDRWEVAAQSAQAGQTEPISSSKALEAQEDAP